MNQHNLGFFPAREKKKIIIEGQNKNMLYIRKLQDLSGPATGTSNSQEEERLVMHRKC